MTKGIVARIQDMLETIDELERATAGKTFEDFQRDWLLIAASGHLDDRQGDAGLCDQRPLSPAPSFRSPRLPTGFR